MSRKQPKQDNHITQEQEQEKQITQEQQDIAYEQESSNLTEEPLSEAEHESLEDASHVADKKLTELEEALTQANDKYLRLYAEFDNFRKRFAKEKLALIETAGKDILNQLLFVVDDFERAMGAMQTNQPGEIEAMQQGVQLIYDKLTHLLEQAGVQAMQLDQGSDFDPELHEAVTQTPVEEPLKGKIVEVIEKGYFLKNHLLRIAKVVIGV